jgi:hypothetical protein
VATDGRNKRILIEFPKRGESLMIDMAISQTNFNFMFEELKNFLFFGAKLSVELVFSRISSSQSHMESEPTGCRKSSPKRSNAFS